MAGVTIAAISGDNGILQNAARAKEETEAVTLEEKIKLLMAEGIINEYTGENEEKTAQELQDELNEQGENVLVVQWDKYIIFDLNKNKEYRVMSDGTTEYWGESIMGQTLLNTKTANADQLSQNPSSSNLIGIDNDGNTVNMLLWEKTLIDDSSLGKVGTYGLNDKNGLDASGASGRSAGYIGSYTEDGKIIGTVPTYISEDGGNTYISVTSMIHTFYDCDELLTAPQIAYTTTNMSLAFFQATNLTTVPSKIPDSVVNFSYAFANCEKLNSLPTLGNNINNMNNSFRATAITEFNLAIPDSVMDMSYAFNGCENLTEFSTNIPENVTTLKGTFSNCTNLTTVPKVIPDSVIDMESTFYNCSSLINGPSILSNKVENMRATFYGCISLKTGPDVIPSSVINMFETFFKCSNLTGKIQINANLNGKIVHQYNGSVYRDYTRCFSEASTIGSGLIISKNSACLELENLLNTKSSTSNIIIEK